MTWRARLASKLKVDPCRLIFVGSACTGVSLNPHKNWKGFDDDSDVDVAVVAPFYFEVAWRFLRNLGARRFQYSQTIQRAIQSHIETYIFWGTIATDKILHILPFGKPWLIALSDMAQIPPTEGRDINLRLYKDFESLRDYQFHNIKKRRDALLESEGGSNEPLSAHHTP